MKVSFVQNYDNVAPTKFPSGNKYIGVPKMTHEQVKKANLERTLPDDYYIHAYTPNSVRSMPTRMITITKGLPKVHYGQEFITKFIPKGLVLENYKNKTYLKEENVDIQKYNKKINIGLAVGAAAAAGMYCAKRGIDLII